MHENRCSWLFCCRVAVRSAAGLAVQQVPSARGRLPGLSARGRPPGPSAGGRPTRTFVRTRGRPDSPGRRPSDVIFPKDVQCDNFGSTFKLKSTPLICYHNFLTMFHKKHSKIVIFNAKRKIDFFFGRKGN
jgi:hypothetical protein